MNKIYFSICMWAMLLPMCVSFSWVGLPPQSGDRNFLVTTPHVHHRAIDGLTGFIQVKATNQKNAKSTLFDMTNLQEYLKDVDHQLMTLQSKISDLEQMKQTYELLKNAFVGQGNADACPKCPLCPLPMHIPPPRPCTLFGISTTERTKRRSTTTTPTTTTTTPTTTTTTTSRYDNTELEQDNYDDIEVSDYDW